MSISAEPAARSELGLVEPRAAEPGAARVRPAPQARDVHRRGWLIRRALLVADVLGLAFAFLLAELLFHSPPTADRIDVQTEYVFFLLTLPAWVVTAKIYGLYERDEERADHSTVDEVVDVLHLVTVGAWLLFAGAWLTGVAEPNLEKLVTFWMLAILLITLGRVGARATARRQVSYLQNTLIVGAGEVGQSVAHKLLRHPEYGLNLVGFVDAEPLDLQPGLEHVAMLGAPDRLRELVELLDVERVIFAFSSEPHVDTLELIRSIEDTSAQVALVPRLFELIGTRVEVHTIEGIPMIGLRAPHLTASSQLLKRVLDVTLSAAGLIVLAPLLAAVALMIKRTSPGPILFRQPRVGEGGRIFSIFKFRTMYVDAEVRKAEIAHLNVHARKGGDPRMFKIPSDPRVTRLGAILRRYSIDELPQLVNVLRGEMSLVGPRPLIRDEDSFVDSWGRRRLDLKPGITGLWQVLGRSDISFDEMIRFDYVYVTNWSIGYDLRLLFRTLPTVLRGNGSY